VLPPASASAARRSVVNIFLLCVDEFIGSMYSDYAELLFHCLRVSKADCAPFQNFVKSRLTTLHGAQVRGHKQNKSRRPPGRSLPPLLRRRGQGRLGQLPPRTLLPTHLSPISSLSGSQLVTPSPPAPSAARTPPINGANCASSVPTSLSFAAATTPPSASASTVSVSRALHYFILKSRHQTRKNKEHPSLIA
jgi:hypothetical protein